MLMDQQEKLLSYNGKLLIFQLSKLKSTQGGGTKVMKLHVRRMSFDSCTKQFIETSTGSFGNCEDGVEMIHCSCASDFRTGILHPCVLLKKKMKKTTKYTLLLLHNSNKFELVLHFKLDYELKEPIKLLSGPTVLWSHAKSLFHISPQTCTVLCAPVQLCSIKWAGEIKGEGAVVLGTRAACLTDGGNGQSVPKSDAFIWGTEFFAYAVEKQQALTRATFVPHAYGGVVSCVHVCEVDAVRSKFRTSVVVVTCKSQVIIFQDGLPKDVHQLPYENPCSVQVAAVEGNSQLVVVTFASGDVCALWKRNLQVVSSWKNVRSILVDDFVGIGTEQILVLLKAHSISESLNTFQISNFGNVHHVNNISYEDDSHSTQELQKNHFLTIKGLEARLQAGFASVRELQQHLRLKEKVLVESCGALIDLVQDQKHSLPSAEKAGLVSLWDEPLDNGTSTPSIDKEQLVQEVWYRVVEDNLVVGVKLMDTYDLLLSDVRLSLVMGRKCPSAFPAKCRCRVVALKKAALAESASHWHLEPLLKRIKLDCHNGKDCNGEPSQVKVDRTKTFTAVTQLSPFLALHEVGCVVLLHATERSCRDDERLQKSKRMTLLCGKILLSLAEISAGKCSINLKDYKYTGSIKDLVALCAVSHKVSLQIISSDYTLIHIKTWLQEQMECAAIKEYPDTFISCKSGNLNGTVFKWNLKTPFEGTLTVFYRHQTILFQCLHNLTGSLPPACKIKPLRVGSKRVLAEQLALTLEKEMVTLRQASSAALSQPENYLSLIYEESKEASSVSAVQQFREQFQREQKQCMLGMNRTVGGALYRRLILNVFESQLDSDTIAWQCSLLSKLL
uniref:FA complementation group B n=1 Tax=Podarcis muralis TaxID=64176 RepID=A0A670IGN7_PODMU|nr:Fanconi anemia group B protein isoform X1 [Podarcis muralis]XP_028583478.1 Fanconi anemia group B protein isoform X1 [Podarcis muralis]